MFQVKRKFPLNQLNLNKQNDWVSIFKQFYNVDSLFKAEGFYGYVMKYTQQNMKKSNKTKVHHDELLEDLDKILNSINVLDNLDIEKDNLDKVKEKIIKDSNKINKKYKEYLPKENLDSKK